ncbi:hypothetical protein CANDROIZ_190008 [Candidatus Roizmanbacteria bacterium]|nr:hypothetical protein CANDROIZ_190008 [Candidatus Roizmanbacteria bacterium]
MCLIVPGVLIAPFIISVIIQNFSEGTGGGGGGYTGDSKDGKPWY